MKYVTAEFHATQHIRSLYTSYFSLRTFLSQNISFHWTERVLVYVDCLNEICKHSMNFILENIKILEERKKIREEKKKKKSCLQYVYFCENDKQLNWIKCIDV